MRLRGLSETRKLYRLDARDAFLHREARLRSDRCAALLP
jgi:hypothetical protein